VKITISRLKAKCKDQVAPFEGLWGFNSKQDFYGGTIFRLPLRPEKFRSVLLNYHFSPDPATTIQILRDLLDEVRLSLLFLRNIRRIEFGIRYRADCEWQVSRKRWPKPSSSDWAFVAVKRRGANSEYLAEEDRWWRVMVDVDDAPDKFRSLNKRRTKHIDCGIAAYVPEDDMHTAQRSLNRLGSRFFNCVPLKFSSTLPVQVHAAFLLSDDLETVAFGDTSQDASSDWNEWLLLKKVPQVYFRLLEDLGRNIGQTIYNYFPIEANGNHEPLSDLVQAAFWQEFRSSQHQIFPVQPWKGKFDRAPLMVEARQAIFNLFPPFGISDAFRPLLSNHLQNLVFPPLKLNRYLRASPHLNFVTPADVRRILQFESVEPSVKAARNLKAIHFSGLLSFITPQLDNDYLGLMGCRILPLRNGDLGALSPAGGEGTQTYFSASAKCQGIFLSASSHFLQDDADNGFFSKLLDSGRFNLRRFERRHVAVILGADTSWKSDEISVPWLYRLWEYLNSAKTLQPLDEELKVSDLAYLEHLPLLSIQQGSMVKVASLHYFRRNAVVVKPSCEHDRQLYSDFDELETVDWKTFPRIDPESGNVLLDLKAMNRFLASLEILATKSGRNVTNYVRPRLKENSRNHLRDLLIRHRLNSKLSIIAARLPLWKPVSSDGEHLTWKEALVAEDPAFLVPWMKDYHLFTLHNSFPKSSVLDGERLLREYILPNLPLRIDKASMEPYLRMIRTIACKSKLRRMGTKEETQPFIPLLSQYRLAARTNGELCYASDLYDHTDTVFACAFRYQSTDKFLEQSIREHLLFWIEIGLHQRTLGKYSEQDVLLCLQILERRLTGTPDLHLSHDTRVILSQLCANPSVLGELTETTWTAVKDLKVFPVGAVPKNEPSYRRSRSEILVSESKPLSLNMIVRRLHDHLCWSQTPFPLHEPSDSFVQRSGIEDGPSHEMVWRHLEFLAKLVPEVKEADVDCFKDELQHTYAFLDRYGHDGSFAFNKVHEAIWWNVEASHPRQVGLGLLRSSWTSLENLVLNGPCDSPPLMVVRPFLARFPNLLKSVGCRSLQYPFFAIQPKGRSILTLKGVRIMREAGVFSDVTFEIEGQKISAHRVILANRSDYCKAQFLGPWAPKPGLPSIVPFSEMALDILKIMIDYCYSDDLDWTGDDGGARFQAKQTERESVIASKLDTLLEVLVAADRWQMPGLRHAAECQILGGHRLFVRLNNVDYVKQMAQKANAKTLLGYCQDFVVANIEAVALVTAHSSNDKD
jgi:sacsin